MSFLARLSSTFAAASLMVSVASAQEVTPLAVPPVTGTYHDRVFGSWSMPHQSMEACINMAKSQYVRTRKNIIDFVRCAENPADASVMPRITVLDFTNGELKIE